MGVPGGSASYFRVNNFIILGAGLNDIHTKAIIDTSLGDNTSIEEAVKSDIPLLAVGGVTADNFMNFIRMGMAGAGIGANILNSDYIKESRFDQITKLAEICTKQLEGENHQ